MELTFLGTGAGVPSKQRNMAATMLKLLDESNEMWLFDCGEGTQQQLLRTTLKPRKISKIFITHLHGDHLYGLPGLISSRSFQGGDDQPLVLYGPKGLRQYVKTSLSVSKTHLTYPIKIVELDEKQSGVCFEDANYIVTYGLLEHAITCYGYRVEEKPKQGRLMMDKLAPYGIKPGPILGKLKKREIVTLEDGTVLDGHDFVTEDQPGKIVSIYGDTRQTKMGVLLAKGADVLVHEATYLAGNEKMARQYYHSTSRQAAEVAKEAGVKQLYLTHLSARYQGEEAQLMEQDAKKIGVKAHVVHDLEEVKIS